MNARPVRSLGPARFGVACALVSLLPACTPRPDPFECGAMLDRYIEMSARSDPALAGTPPEAADDRVRAIVAGKRNEAVYTAARARCLHEVSASEYACAMKAPTPNEWEACVQ